MIFPEERLHKTWGKGAGWGGFKSHKKLRHSFEWWTHIYATKRLLLKQGGDCVAWQINFPLPHTHLIPQEALIQPLPSPLASADWLTYGIALFCFSSSPRSPENQTLLPVNLFWFLFGKESSFLYIFELWLHGLNPLNQTDLPIWHNIQVVFYGNKQVWQRFVVRPPMKASTCYCSWSIGVLTSRDSNAGIFNSYSESAQRSFILYWLRAHLQHAFDIRVTQGYHTVHHSSCNNSLKGRLKLKSPTCLFQHQREWAHSEQALLVTIQ